MRSIRWMVLAALTAVLLPTPVWAGGTLTLVSIQEGQDVQGWWVSNPAGGLSDLETELRDRLSGEVRVINPAKAEGRPVISRIYRIPQLSVRNAVNLAGLYDVSRALVGSAVYRRLDVAQQVGFEGVEVSIQVQWVSVPTGAVLLDARLRRSGWEATPTLARQAAEQAVIDDLQALVRDASRNLSGSVGLAIEGTFVEVHGLWSGQAMRSFEKTLAGVPGVVTLRLAWAVEGGLAYELNAGGEPDAALAERARAVLVAQSPAGMVLEETDRGLVARRSIVPESEETE